MTILKYIITSTNIPVIFSKEIQHNTVLQTGVSAGFLILSYNQRTGKFRAKCFGNSSSLNLVPMSNDVVVIEEYLNNSFVSILKFS